MNIKPTGKNVAIAEQKKENTTASGIIVEGNYGDSKLSTVLAVGPDVKGITVGSTVVPNWGKAIAFTYEGAQRAVISEDDILCTLE